MRFFFLFFLFYAFSPNCFAQTLTGVVTDKASGETLIGVNIILEDGGGTTTDFDGKYTLKMEAGTSNVTFRFVGYHPITKTVTIKEGENKSINIALQDKSTELGMVVVSAGRFEQKIEEVTVSMEVIAPELIENKSTASLETALDQVPGCTVQDGQVSIRGGSGFAYGAGSRVSMMVDGMPLLAGDAGDVKWNTLPVENIEQIEVVKGASSVLFGSSALNGIINIRTRYPKDEPQTKISVYHGVYGNPIRYNDSTNSYLDSLGNPYRPTQWWDNTPYYAGLNFFHSRKIGNLDVVTGGALFSDQGYREGENEHRGRINASLRYRDKKKEGLSYGINFNTQKSKGGLYILWMDADSGALRPSGGLDPETTTISDYTTYRTNIDPFVEYWTPNGNKHSLRTRFYRTNNTNNTSQAALADFYYAEYQFQRQYEMGLTITSGLASSFTFVKSELYDDHDGNNLAFFSQVDKKWDKLSLSAGLRAEYFRIDTFETVSFVNLGDVRLPIQPVFRMGANYHLFEETYIRSSYGQGYRFPSIGEKFISTQVGPLNIFPNTGLNPETGWSAELGIKQGVKQGNWKGYLDVAAFIQQYKDMMEFSFGVYNPDSIPVSFTPGDPGYVINWVGFRAENVEESRITGVDISLVGTGEIAKDLNMTIFAGYTYLNPISLNSDSAYRSTYSDSTTDMLKYRYQHLAKGDIQFDYKKWSMGLSGRYNSFMVNIDRAFQELNIPVNNGAIPLGDVLLPGIEGYRERNNNGDLVFDFRVACELTMNAKASIVINNLLNREYMTRPGDIQPPRTFITQFVFNF